MARRRSPWGEFLRAQEQRRRQEARAQQEWLTANRRAEQAMVRAQREAQQRAAADAREQERLLHEGGVAEAARLSDEVEQRVNALKAILASSLATAPGLSFARMRRRGQAPPFQPGSRAVPIPAPRW